MIHERSINIKSETETESGMEVTRKQNLNYKQIKNVHPDKSINESTS